MDHLEAHQVSPFIKIDLSIVVAAYYTGFVYEAFEASEKDGLSRRQI